MSADNTRPDPDTVRAELAEAADLLSEAATKIDNAVKGTGCEGWYRLYITNYLRSFIDEECGTGLQAGVADLEELLELGEDEE